MRKLIIERTLNSPGVIFDPDRNFFEISGESRPPEVAAFYSEILDWFDDYSSNVARSGKRTEPVVFNLDFEYFNSSSEKYLLDFCKKINSASAGGMNLSVRWLYEKNDIDMLEAGKRISKIVKYPFEYLEKQ
ncbi:MAG: DUF1987 domain-containing protein [Bacteroidales bacterium]|nr:DUF1987 domain-containing protein [Bacteroidales bacterium]